MTKSKYPVLHTYTYDAYRVVSNKDPVAGFLEQVRLLKRPIEKCIERAYKEGTDLIIEGNHLVPGYIKTKNVSAFIVLQDDNFGKEILNSKTHRKIRISQKEISRINMIENFILQQAENESIPIVKIKRNIPQTVKRVIEAMKVYQKTNIKK